MPKFNKKKQLLQNLMKYVELTKLKTRQWKVLRSINYFGNSFIAIIFI